jgi:reverse gyrase
MPKTMYINLSEVNELQTDIMNLIQDWVKNQRTPVPHKQILILMKEKGVGNPSTVNALQSLLHKGYIRRAVMISNKTFYVQLRRL